MYGENGCENRTTNECSDIDFQRAQKRDKRSSHTTPSATATQARVRYQLQRSRWVQMSSAPLSVLLRFILRRRLVPVAYANADLMQVITQYLTGSFATAHQNTTHTCYGQTVAAANSTLAAESISGNTPSSP